MKTRSNACTEHRDLISSQRIKVTEEEKLTVVKKKSKKCEMRYFDIDFSHSE